MAEGKGTVLVCRHYSNAVRVEVDESEGWGTEGVEGEFVEEGAGGDVGVAFSLCFFETGAVYSDVTVRLETVP